MVTCAGTVLAGHEHGRELHVVFQRAARHLVAQAHLDHRSLHVGLVALRLVDGGGRWMVAQVLAHAGGIMHHADAQALQVVLGADAGEHQDLRAMPRRRWRG